MASLIDQGVGTSKGREDEQVSELSMRADQFPSIEQPDSDRLTAYQGDGSAARPASTQTLERVYRHRLPVRISHWLNIPILIILLMSGLQIFNAHPALYWGDRSDRDQP